MRGHGRALRPWSAARPRAPLLLRRRLPRASRACRRGAGSLKRTWPRLQMRVRRALRLGFGLVGAGVECSVCNCCVSRLGPSRQPCRHGAILCCSRAARSRPCCLVPCDVGTDLQHFDAAQTPAPADDEWGDTGAAAAPTNTHQQQQPEGQWGTGFAGSGYGALPPAQQQQQYGSYGAYGGGAPAAPPQQGGWGGGGGGGEFNDSAEVLCPTCNGPCNRRTSNTPKNPGRWVLLAAVGQVLLVQMASGQAAGSCHMLCRLQSQGSMRPPLLSAGCSTSAPTRRAGSSSEPRGGAGLCVKDWGPLAWQPAQHLRAPMSAALSLMC